MPRDLVFVSYARADQAMFDDLMTHLKPIVRNMGLAVWSDREICIGDKWRQTIDEALARTKVAVMLVSPAFLASDFINDVELPALLEAAEDHALRVIWVPIKPSGFSETPIKDYQAAHDPAQPISALKPSDRDAAWVAVCRHIKAASGN